jgi:preprotein translocase subunit SecD
MKNSFLPRVLILLIIVVSLLINLSEPFSLNIGAYKFNFPGINLSFIPGLSENSFALRKGLDLEGGTSITLRADMKDVAENQRDDALASAKAVIERRVDFFGVAEPVVRTSKSGEEYRIIAEIPGITDAEKASELIGTTAKLTFWEGAVPSLSPLSATEAAQIATRSGVPAGIIKELGKNAKKTDLSGADLKNSSVTFDQNTAQPVVSLSFSSKGAKKFADITSRNVGGFLAIVLDDQVIQTPRVNEPIFGGEAVISGGFTTETAKSLQIQLNAGALPVSLSTIQQKATGATLGADSLQKSLFAGLVGFLVIVIFMVVIYGKLGAIASLALVVYTLVVLALFRIIPVTLTLAGIAGFILSIGVAVDANILIFERMKEEMRRGLSRERAIDLGFTRAWPSIRDSNIASLITSAILYYFGTTIVRGFAFVLAIGVIVSMFSAITVTKTLLKIFYKNNLN